MAIPTPPSDLTGMTVLYEGTPCTVDIICIHGLNSTSERCWTAGNVLWLKDLLPRTPGLECTRIVTFGYNSNIFRDPSSAKIKDHATNLLQDLIDERRSKESQNRPIIFVCHSLGGIIAKQALVNAHQSDRFGAIKDSTYGIIFLGTPHRGSETASLGKIVARISTLGLQRPKTQLLKFLKKDSQQLQDLSEQFSNLHSRFRIVTFFEQKETAYGWGFLRSTKLIVPEASAKLGIEGEILVPMNTDHHDICKFNCISDTGYRRVQNRILELVRDSGSAPHSDESSRPGPQDTNRGYRNLDAPGYQLKYVHSLYQKCANLLCNIHKHTRHLGRHFDQCQEKLSSQAALFSHTFQIILLEHVGENDVQAMLNNPNHSAWNNPKLQDDLSMTSSSFNDLLTDSREILNTIECRLSKLWAGIGQPDFHHSSLHEEGGGGHDLRSESKALLGLIRSLKIPYPNIRYVKRGPPPADTTAQHPEKNQTSSEREEALIQLLNIREVAKGVYDGLALSARCSCHRVNLQLQNLLGEPKSKASTNPTGPRMLSSPGPVVSDLTPIVSSPGSYSAISFRLILTKDIGSGKARDSERFDCTCITIDSEGHSTAPDCVTAAFTPRTNRRVRFEDVSDSGTASTRAIETLSGDGEAIPKSIKSSTGREKFIPGIETAKYSTRNSPAITGTTTACNSKFVDHDINGLNPEPTSTVDAPVVDNLCSFLLSTKPRIGGPTKELLGRIPQNQSISTYRHLVYREARNHYLAGPTSLDRMLEDPQQHSPLTQLDRLKLALILSLSLLHFGSYSTSWFQERWRSRDIYFFLEPEKPRGHRIALDPYVVPSFPPPTPAKRMSGNETATQMAQTPGLARNEHLFSLTLVLIEIGFGTTLFNIRENADIPVKIGDDYIEHIKVRKILEEGKLGSEMGSRYAKVVSQCYNYDFAIEFGEGGVDLDKKEFQENFYNRVISELKHCVAKY